ncbi:MAG: nucleotidyltransferase family protein [Candidatus Heimdallarchaeota archaeon]
MLTQEAILLKLEENSDSIRRFGVQKIGLFGSFAKREAEPDSDIDFFVEFEEGKKTFDNYMDLKFFLEDLLDRHIDLVTRPALKADLEATITRSILYASGL